MEARKGEAKLERAASCPVERREKTGREQTCLWPPGGHSRGQGRGKASGAEGMGVRAEATGFSWRGAGEGAAWHLPVTESCLVSCKSQLRN